MRRQSYVLFFVCFFIIVPLTFATVVFVKKSETLSAIVYANLKTSLFRQKSLLNKILADNPHIKNPNLIFPGQKIILGNAEIEPQKEIVTNQTPVLSVVIAKQQSLAEQSKELASDTSEITRLRNPSLGPHFTADLGFEFFRIDSTDKSSNANSVFLSNMNPQLLLGWDRVDTDWAVRTQLGIMAQDLTKNDSSSTLTIEIPGKMRYSF